MRPPSTLITGQDGKDMELNPRQVDVPVIWAIGEWYAGKDTQLDAAVKTLLAPTDLPAYMLRLHRFPELGSQGLEVTVGGPVYPHRLHHHPEQRVRDVSRLGDRDLGSRA